MYRTPFIVVANKIDRLLVGKVHEGASFRETFSNQAKSVQQDLDNKIYEIVGELHKEGFQSEKI